MRVLAIKERHLRTATGEIASLADFTYVEGDEVDPEVVIEDPDLSLYCLDDAGKRAIFVKLPPGVDLTEAPFVYQAQGERAERLVAVAYDDFVLLAAGLPEVKNLVSIYGTGRSGSTLISHAFNASGAVVSLSEPDVPTQVAYLRDPDGSRDAELGRLLDGTMRFLFKPAGSQHPSVGALKYRNEVNRVMDLHQATFPRAKNLLLYRDAVGWVASIYRILKSWGMPEHQPLRELLGGFEQDSKKDAAEVRRYLGEGDQDVPLLKVVALWWLFHMEACLAQYERGVRALAVRYDDLNRHREAVVREIFAYCGLPVSNVAKALKAFEKDAQAGTPLARENATKGNALKLSNQQLADVYDVLERHPVINTPNFVLPGTLSV